MISMIQKIFIIVGMLTSFLVAQISHGPQEISTASTFATQSRGDDVLGWNPANLGLEDNPRWSLGFGLLPMVPIPSFELNNSSISPNWINDYLLGGIYLDSKTKDEMLDVFHNNRWDVYPSIQAKFLGFSYQNFAISAGLEMNTSISLSKSLFELVFSGLLFDEPMNLDEMNIGMQTVLPISMAYGTEMDIPFLSDYTEETYVGVGTKILFGLVYFETEKFNASLESKKDRVLGEGEIIMRYNLGGTFFQKDSLLSYTSVVDERKNINGLGFSFDIGVSVKILDEMTANIAFNNLFGSIHWDKTTSYQHELSYDLDLTSEEFEDIADYNESQEDSLLETIITNDTSYAIDGFTTNYPTYMLVGFQYDLMDKLTVFTNYRQVFSSSFYTSLTPRFSIASEYRPWKWLPIRSGFSIGGLEGFQWGFGLGLKFPHYALDIGFSQNGGMFNNAKGLSLSIEQKLLF